MEERRTARAGTVTGLAMLVGGTAIAAVSRGTHSVFATIMLALLAAGMGHALLDEIRRQARRRSTTGWDTLDTINTVLLASWGTAALSITVLTATPAAVRFVGLALSIGYAATCGYFVVERRRTITTGADAPVGRVPS